MKKKKELSSKLLVIFWKTKTKKFDKDEAGIKDLISLF